MSWWVWPQPVEVVALVQVPAAPIPVSENSVQLLLTALNNPTLLNDAIAITGNGHLRMLRDQSDPADWVRKGLEVEVLKNSIVSIKLSVPRHYASDAIEFVDYIMLRAVADVDSKLVRSGHSRRDKRAVQQAIYETIQRRQQLLASPVDPRRAAEVDLQLALQLEDWNRVKAAGLGTLVFLRPTIIQTATPTTPGQ